jgi:hypothetical protein
MPKEQPEAETLERGNIYFAYRPKVSEPGEEVRVKGLGEVERTYIILSVIGRRMYRRIVVGRKKLPDVEGGGERFWGVVDLVGGNPEKIEDELDEEVYGTKTRGERKMPAARPAGEGVYRIVAHGNHTHLIYALELPKKPGPVQKELNIEPEASYIISVKNPEKGSPPQAGLSRGQKVDYPKHLQEKFASRRFINAEPELLDHEGAEVVLVGAREDPERELDLKLHPQSESEWTADIFKDLRMEKSEHPLEPLFKGQWE